jgi:hypothetical protein
MLVHVDMIERQAGGSKSLELRRDLRRHLPAQRRAAGQFQPQPRQVSAQPSVLLDQAANALRRQRRRSLDHDHVQTDAQRRQRTRAPHRVGGGRPGNHQACSSENTEAMRRLDGLVDLFGQAEVVGGDDESLQCTISR